MCACVCVGGGLLGWQRWERKKETLPVLTCCDRFLGNLFQQIEGQAAGAGGLVTLFRDQLAGVVSSELTTSDGTRFSATDQPFTFLSVNVKNKKTLLEALKEVRVL